MQSIADAARCFFEDVGAKQLEFANEAELQHELGWWLRTRLPSDWRLYFERPVASFFPTKRRLVKKEIDLVVESPDRKLYAIELKCPRNGRHPETMFDVCRDLEFLEQLIEEGFAAGLFAVHVNDPCFYERGSTAGIYSHFRSSVPLVEKILKPTGRKDMIVSLTGSYRVQWQDCGTDGRFWLQLVLPRLQP